MNLDDPMDDKFGSANFDPTYLPIMNLEMKINGKDGSKRPTTMIKTGGVILDPTNTPILNLDDEDSVYDDKFFGSMQSRSARFDPSNTPILNLASDAFKLATSGATKFSLQPNTNSKGVIGGAIFDP